MIKPSVYLDQFKNARDVVGSDLLITGGHLLVEKPIWKEIVNKSGLITGLSAAEENVDDSSRPCLVHVLAVGEGYYNEDDEHIPLEIQPGDILLVGQFAPRWFSTFGMQSYKKDTVGIVHEKEVQIRFTSIEALERFTASLNK